MSIRVALYLRVSTSQQETDNQRLALEAECQRRGWEVVGVYEEEESAWAGGRQTELRRAFHDAQRGMFQVLLVWALDRLSREGAAAMIIAVHRFGKAGVQVISHSEAWTQVGGEYVELLLAFAGWAAKVESDKKSRNTKLGMARASKTGTRSGRPIGRPLGRKDSRKRQAKRVRAVWESEW